MCMCKQEGESGRAAERGSEREKERDLTSALLEMGFLWMGGLGEGWKHIKSHFQFVAGS